MKSFFQCIMFLYFFNQLLFRNLLPAKFRIPLKLSYHVLCLRFPLFPGQRSESIARKSTVTGESLRNLNRRLLRACRLSMRILRAVCCHLAVASRGDSTWSRTRGSIVEKGRVRWFPPGMCVPTSGKSPATWRQTHTWTFEIYKLRILDVISLLNVETMRHTTK